MEDSQICSFCGKTRDEVLALVASQDGSMICDECVDIITEQYGSFPPPDDAVQAPEMGRVDSSVTCSFCGICLRDVLKCVAGPRVYICDKCVEACARTIGESGVEPFPE